jgi:hypothetical protein
MKSRILTVILTVGLLVTLNCSSRMTSTQGANTNASNTSSGTSSGGASGATPQATSSAQPVESIKTTYTELSGSGCGAPRTTSEVSAERTCSGVEGYKLIIQTDDDRDSIAIITPDGRQHPLNFWETISKGAFNSIGQKAEWRIASRNGKDVPIALIVRVDVQSGDTNKTVSYLSVSKISDREICVTDRIEPGADQNEKARVAADSSANRKCLSGS